MALLVLNKWAQSYRTLSILSGLLDNLELCLLTFCVFLKLYNMVYPKALFPIKQTNKKQNKYMLKNLSLMSHHLVYFHANIVMTHTYPIRDGEGTLG